MSSSDEQEFYWEEDYWESGHPEPRPQGDHTLQHLPSEEEGGDGEEAGSAVGGVQHHLDHLQHNMILQDATKVGKNDGDDDNHILGPITDKFAIQIQSVRPKLFGLPGGSEIPRTPPSMADKSGGKSLVTPKGATYATARDVTSTDDAFGSSMTDTGGTPVGAHRPSPASPPTATSHLHQSTPAGVAGAAGAAGVGGGAGIAGGAGAVRPHLTRCQRCTSCKTRGCLTRSDPYSCLNCISKSFSCCLRPHCQTWSKENAQTWYDFVTNENQRLAFKRTDCISHVIDTCAGKVKISILKSKSLKPKVYPDLSNIEETNENVTSDKTAVETAGLEERDKKDDKVQNTAETATDTDVRMMKMITDFKTETEQKHRAEMDEIKSLFTAHLANQTKLINDLLKMKSEDRNDGNADSEDKKDVNAYAKDEDDDYYEDDSDEVKLSQPFHPSAPPEEFHTPTSSNPVPSRPVLSRPIPSRPAISPSRAPAEDAILRLADVLQRQFDAPPKNIARLPALSIPQLQTESGKPVGCSYFTWKSRCLQIFQENAIADSVAVNLLQSEKSLSKKWAASIAQCTSVAEIFKTLDTMTPSKDSVLPSLIKQLTEVSSAFSNSEQLNLCDTICRVILQIQTHFPGEDLTLGQLTSCLSSFQSQSEITLLPNLVRDFKAKHAHTKSKYVDILFEYCTEKRADLYSILAALDQYRGEDTILHQNLIAGAGRGRGGGREGGRFARGARGGRGGNWGRGRGASLAGADTAQQTLPSYRGGSKLRPGPCGVCGEQLSSHKYFLCPDIKLFRNKQKAFPKDNCIKCLKPKANCRAGETKTGNKCDVKTRRDGSTTSTLCQKHGNKVYWAACQNCGDDNIVNPFKAAIPHLFLQPIESDEEHCATSTESAAAAAGNGIYVADGDVGVYEGDVACRAVGAESATAAAAAAPSQASTPAAAAAAPTQASTPAAVRSTDFYNISANAPCVFLIQTLDAEISGLKIKLNICYDTGAGCSSIRLAPAILNNKSIKPKGQRRATLVTVAGKTSQLFNIFTITIRGENSSWVFDCMEMKTLPSPTVRQDLYQAVKNAGFAFLPSQQELSDHCYCLLGAQHLAAFPSPLKRQLVPRDLRLRYPRLCLYQSAVDSTMMVGGCITKGNKYNQHLFIANDDNEDEVDDEKHDHDDEPPNGHSKIWKTADHADTHAHPQDENVSSSSSDDDDDDDDNFGMFFINSHRRTNDDDASSSWDDDHFADDDIYYSDIDTDDDAEDDDGSDDKNNGNDEMQSPVCSKSESADEANTHIMHDEKPSPSSTIADDDDANKSCMFATESHHYSDDDIYLSDISSDDDTDDEDDRNDGNIDDETPPSVYIKSWTTANEANIHITHDENVSPSSSNDDDDDDNTSRMSLINNHHHDDENKNSPSYDTIINNDHHDEDKTFLSDGHCTTANSHCHCTSDNSQSQMHCAAQRKECIVQSTTCCTRLTCGPANYQNSHHNNGMFSTPAHPHTHHDANAGDVHDDSHDDDDDNDNDDDHDNDDNHDNDMAESSHSTFQHWCIVKDDETKTGESTHFKNFRSSKSTLHRNQYKDFLDECKAAFRGNKIQLGCQFCDKRITTFAVGKELNSFYLKSLVKFTKNNQSFGGAFVYSRRHLKSIDCLPNGLRQAAARLTKFSSSLDTMPSSALYLNHSLATAYLNGRSKWMDEFEPSLVSKLQLHVCPLQVVKKTSEGSTTILRVTQAANSLYRSLCSENCACKSKMSKSTDNKSDHDDDGDDFIQDDDDDDDDDNAAAPQLSDTNVNHNISRQPAKHQQRSSDCNVKQCDTMMSLNSTIEDYAQQLPAIPDLALSLRLSVVAGVADLEKFFTQIKMDMPTSFLQASLVYKCQKSGLPTFSNKSENIPNQKQVLIPTHCAFGLSDLSQCAQACSDQIGGIYEQYLKEDPAHRKNAFEVLKAACINAPWILTENWESAFYSQQSDYALKTALYIDDYAGYIGLQMVVSFLHQKSLHNAKVHNSAQCSASQCSAAECSVQAQHSPTDFQWSDETLLQTATELQLNITAYTILALQYTGFNFKSFDSCSSNKGQLNNLIKITKPVKIQPNFEKPSNDAVRSEHMPRGSKMQRKSEAEQRQKVAGDQGSRGAEGQRSREGGEQPAVRACGSVTAHPTGSPSPHLESKVYLSQLGVNYHLDGTCSLRSKSLKLKSKRGQPARICHNVTEYDNWLESKGTVATKRDAAAILGMCFSQQLGLHHAFPTMIIKFLMATCARVKSGEKWDWNSSIPTDLLHYLRAAVRLYFLSANARYERCTVKHSMSAVNILIAAGDASGFLNSTCHFLVQITSIGNSKNQSVQLLSTGVYLSKASILSIVYYECIALCRAVAKSVDLYHLLNKIGLHIHPSNVIHLTDSSATCYMAKTPPPQLQKKYSHIVSKICLHLLSINTSPQESIFFFSQRNKKRETGELFVADVISKVPTNLSEDEIVETLPKLWTESVKWMQNPIESWSFITDFPRNVPMRNTVCRQFSLTASTVADLCKARMSPDTFQIFKTLPVGGDRVKQPLPCHELLRYDDEFHHLMRRKLSNVHKKGSAFNILALCVHYMLKLKTISKLDHKQKQDIKIKLKQELTERRDNFTPWWPSCYIRCGLVEGLSCGGVHHITKYPFFGELTNTWPHFGTECPVAARNVMTVLKSQMKALSYNWTEHHQTVLTQYVFSTLSAKQQNIEPVKNTARLDININMNKLYLAVGRRQGTIINHHQSNLGFPLFRVLGSDIFALSVIRYFHIKSDHNRKRAKLAILKSGFITAQLENVLWEAEQCCQECRLRKGMNIATNSGLYTKISGTSFNLGNTAFNPTSHSFATDCFGPMDSKDGVLHCILFISTLNGLCYSFVIQDMGITGVIQAVQCLSAVAGNIKIVISDQGSNFAPFADVLQMENCSDDETRGLPSKNRQPRNPLARLLDRNLEGNNGGITWKLVCAENHSQAGVAEAAVKVIRRGLRHARFYQQCKDFNLSKVAAFCSAAVTIYNSRPLYTLDDGECYSPYDIMSLTQMGASCPENDLQLYSENTELKTRFQEYKKFRKEIQLQIFQNYCKFLYLSSSFKERGKFQMRSDDLQPGDLVLSKAAFIQSKNITKSIRRIHKLDASKRHAIVYHVVESNDNFDTELFNIAFRKCKTTTEKQKLVKQYFGRFSFQSIDLREVSFLCGRDTERLELSIRRSRNPESIKKSDDPVCFAFENVYKRLKSKPFNPSVKVANLPGEAGEMILRDDNLNLRDDNLNLNLEWKDRDKECYVLPVSPPTRDVNNPILTLKCAEPKDIIVDHSKLNNPKPKNRKSKKKC